MKTKPPKPIKIGIEEYGRKAIEVYGTETLKHRAVPSLVDGLKPVQRRILWSMHELGLHPKAKRMKASRTVGECLGKYHPHSNEAIYQAMCTMADAPEPLLDTEGNWGTLTNGAAAQRYVEARLSAFAQANYFDPRYTPVIEYMLNYDDTTKEPMHLPSQTLELLVNGSRGISVGATCHIPSFTRESVDKVLRAYLKGKKISVDWIARTLDHRLSYGGRMANTVSNGNAMRELVAHGKGSITFHPVWKAQSTNKIVVTGFVSHIRDSTALTRIAGMEQVSSVVNESTIENGIRFVITLRRGVRASDERVALKVLRPLIHRHSYHLAYLVEVLDADTGRPSVEFRTGSMLAMFESWIDWRVKLEERALDWEMSECDKRMNRLRLLLLAHDERDVLDACRDSQDPKQYLMTNMPCRAEEADVLLGLSVRQLTRLAHRDLRKELKNEKMGLKTLKRRRTNVRKTLAKQMDIR